MLNTDKEWDFITYETHYRVPENKPCKSMDLAVREILLSLQGLLSIYCANQSTEIANTYQQNKQIYLTLIS
jgi:hypothetical protein